MVSLKQLFDSADVDFIAGRKFILFGQSYELGDEVPRTVVKEARNRESLMRSGRVVIVSDDLNNVPRAYRKEVKDRQLVFKKMKREDKVDFDTTGLTIPKTQEKLNERLEVGIWADALLSEVKGANRVTLVDWIKAGPTDADFDGSDIELFVLDEDNYASGKALDEYAHPADAELAYPTGP